MTPKLPLGFDNFREIIDRKLNFVDKSLFIKDIIDDSETKVAIITRPRRFGKTLNMSMLHHFLAAEVDLLPTKGLFENLNIAKVADGDYLKHQGQYPVIFISLKDLKQLNFQDVVKSFRLSVRELCRAHRYLLNSDKLAQDEKNLFEKFLTGDVAQSDLEKSLKILSELIYKHYGQKSYLLIDEYDSPIHVSFQYDYYQEMVSFIRNLFGSALKGDSFIEKAVVTGILRIAKESMFSELNNVKVYSVLNEKYSQYFGFTEDEVNELLQKFNLQTKASEIKHWYNGYQFGATVIYNPWSIVSCLNENGKLQAYWMNTSENSLVKILFARADKLTKMKLESLVRGEPIEAVIDEYVTFINFEMNASAIWSLLLASGYLKATSCDSSGSRLKCLLASPNYEVSLIYSEMVQEWISDSIGREEYDYFIGSLLKGNIEDFSDMLQKYLEQTFSVFDLGGKSPEKFYHGFVLGLISSTLKTHVVKSNRESGYGLYDVMVIPKDLTKPDALGLILEFKVAKTETENLETTAQTALQQIENRGYEAEMHQAGVTNLIKVGLAFRNKSVKVVYC